MGFKDIISDSDGIGNNDNVRMNNIIIKVDRNFNVDRQTVEDNEHVWDNRLMKNAINYSFKIVIFSIISWSCVYAIVHSVLYKDIKFILSELFTIMLSLQYILGSIYYRSEYFNKALCGIIDYRQYIKVCLTGSFILSLGISIMSVILINNNINIFVYSDIIDYVQRNNQGSDSTNTTTDVTKWKIIINILMFLDKFFSYNIFFTNMIFFAFVFIVYGHNIVQYTEKLELYVVNNEHGFTIDSITREYSELKSLHARTVQSLNHMFSSLTVLGTIGSYLSIMWFDTKYVDTLHIFNVVFFLIIECVYLYSIGRVKSAVDDIKKIINSPIFISKFLSRAYLETFTGEQINDLNLSGATHTMDSIGNNMCYNNLSRGGSGLENKIDFIRDTSIRTMIKEHENAEGVDWLILNHKLAGEWESFNMLGFEINDETIAQKVLGITVGFLMLTNIDKLFA